MNAAMDCHYREMKGIVQDTMVCCHGFTGHFSSPFLSLSLSHQQPGGTHKRVAVFKQPVNSARGALRDYSDRFQGHPTPAKEGAQAGEAKAAESHSVLHEARDERQANSARPTLPTTAEGRRMTQKEASRPVGGFFDNARSYNEPNS